MALAIPTTTATAPLVTLLLLLGTTTGCSGTVGSERGPGAGCFAPLIGCATPAAPGAAGNHTAFRTILAPLLAALPSAAAAAEGFAALRSPASRHAGRARALGLCFAGGGAASGPGCQACLWAAVAALGDGEGGCASGTRRAGIWSDGCLLAYYDDGDESASSSPSDSGGFQFPRPWFVAGDTRPYTDGLELALAHLAKDLAHPKGQSLWGKARSVVVFFLAAIGMATVVVFLCLLVGGYLLLETLARTVAAAAGQQAGGFAAVGQGDGLAVYVAETNGMEMAEHPSGGWRGSSDSTSSWAVCV